MFRLKIGIAGSGAIGLAYAAWVSHGQHDVSVWSPQTGSAELLRSEPLRATGLLEEAFQVSYAKSAEELATGVDVIIIALPLNGHRAVMDALLPHLRTGQIVIVSSMASLSSLYLYEGALKRGIEITVASFGTTALTARRKGPAHVHIMTKRPSLGVSCLPVSQQGLALDVCKSLFGSDFKAEENPLSSMLSNTSAVGHVPLALFNWTRIERGEDWPQYYYMTSRTADVINELDAERLSLASVFGWCLSSFSQKLRQSFNIESVELADVARELHQKRGGPAGPTNIKTRYVWEDVPYGLLFTLALGRIANVAMPATEAIVATAGLIVGEALLKTNDLIEALGLSTETVQGLLSRVNVGAPCKEALC